MKITNDGLLNIATGRSRRETNWKNTEMLWSELVMRFSQTHRTAETYTEYMTANKTRQDEIKDIGGYVGGYIAGGKRKAAAVTSRHMLTLDIDFGTKDLFDDLTMYYGCAAVMYSTHKSSPAQFRGRLVIPLSRTVFKDEYIAIARRIAGDLSIDAFDDTTFQPERLMYWPSTSCDGEYVFEFYDGAFLDADAVLGSYVDWKDVSGWPVSSRVSSIIQREIKKQEDPTEKTGLIGTFCRAYDIHTAIDAFLSDEYTECIDGRYTYTQGSTTAGLVTYDDKFAYSHHGTDPASGKLMNAFDLVRVHMFGLKDDDVDVKERTPANKMPSYTSMLDFIATLPEVRRLSAGERLNSAKLDFETVDEEVDLDWMLDLDVDKKGNYTKKLENLILILQNDPLLKGIVFNELSDGMEITSKVPWKHKSRFWRDADDAQLVTYIDTTYTPFPARQYDKGVAKVVDDRAYHPIKNYFNSLPTWDGVLRAETLFIDYLNAEDNKYTRSATRKWLCAAVERIKNPGCKFDCMLVLNGPQGIGKSTLISILGGEWFSDSLQLSDTQDKTAAEKLQGSWILEIGELAGLKKAEVETLRGFISRQDDKYRAAYGHRVTPHPRQCVFIGTTNAVDGYLRDTAGNRRFWPINVTGGADKKPWELSQEEVNQIWAEVIETQKRGEKLYLDDHTVLEIAEKEQREAMESDAREGLVREYLETLLPDNWNDMNLYSRRDWLSSKQPRITNPGTVERDRVCAQEIWAECFGNDHTKLKNIDTREINQILSKLEGWTRNEKSMRFKIYGVCKGYKYSV